MLRRSPDQVLPIQSAFNSRAIYAKGFPQAVTTIDTIEQYFADTGYKVRLEHACIHSQNRHTVCESLRRQHSTILTVNCFSLARARGTCGAALRALLFSVEDVSAFSRSHHESLRSSRLDGVAPNLIHMTCLHRSSCLCHPRGPFLPLITRPPIGAVHQASSHVQGTHVQGVRLCGVC